jgi:hypothetical protein
VKGLALGMAHPFTLTAVHVLNAAYAMLFQTGFHTLN